MVHITDKRAQKVVSSTSVHITETVFAHDQHWEEQSSLSSVTAFLHYVLLFYLHSRHGKTIWVHLVWKDLSTIFWITT